MTTTDWIALASLRIQETGPHPTDETDETSIDISAKAPVPTDETARTQVSAVLAVPTPVISKTSRPSRTCSRCRHRTGAGTCGEPVAAGLSLRFELVWPESEFAARCPAWRLDPYGAITKVLIVAARELWPRADLDAWLADADEHPAAVLDVLAGRGKP